MRESKTKILSRRKGSRREERRGKGELREEGKEGEGRKEGKRKGDI